MSTHPLLSVNMQKGLIHYNYNYQLVEDVYDSVEEKGMKYLGHDVFAAKYILKVFADRQRRRHA